MSRPPADAQQLPGAPEPMDPDPGVPRLLRVWHVTFGQRYRRELHPTFVAAHPDYWVDIAAASEPEARAKAHRLLGGHWAEMYPDDADWRDRMHYFRGGCLGTYQ